MNNILPKTDEIADVISRDFSINETFSLIPAGQSESLIEFRLYLTKKLTHLLDNNYNTLINILYRIDINEERLSKLFTRENKDSIPADLADLIIERSLQKIKFRQKYKRGEL